MRRVLAGLPKVNTCTIAVLALCLYYNNIEEVRPTERFTVIAMSMTIVLQILQNRRNRPKGRHRK